LKYETRIELIGQMLEVAKDFTNEDHRDNRNAVSKLKAMYKRFTHYNGFVEHLSFLLENDLLAYRKYERRYRITERGLRFLRLYVELRQMISSRQQQVTREQDGLSVYEWPYQVANLSGPDEFPSPHGFI